MSGWRLQSLRFSIIGLVSNVVLYLLYLLLVNVGIDPKLVVSILYILGLSCTFVFNKLWSFSHRGDWGKTGVRYVSFYGGLYFTNILILMLFVDFLEFPHAFIQAIVVIVFIPIVFLVQRYWVFRNNSAVSF
ncbi:GtrA family protein [Alphaproteobacteria bacterium LSUCC0226]